MITIAITADFRFDANGTVLGPEFERANFHFIDKNIASGFPSSVNQSQNGRGLRFDRSGLEVVLPLPRDKVEFRIGNFAEPCEIFAYNNNRDLIAQKTASFTNTYSTMTIEAEKIVKLVYLKGGNEPIIQWITITANVES
ncbi:MAG: hypothetical protein GY927_01750 [bacterium]|nr:hypothetical protein [bacterium]